MHANLLREVGMQKVNLITIKYGEIYSKAFIWKDARSLLFCPRAQPDCGSNGLPSHNSRA